MILFTLTACCKRSHLLITMKGLCWVFYYYWLRMTCRRKRSPKISRRCPEGKHLINNHSFIHSIIFFHPLGLSVCCFFCLVWQKTMLFGETVTGVFHVFVRKSRCIRAHFSLVFFSITLFKLLHCRDASNTQMEMFKHIDILSLIEYIRINRPTSRRLVTMFDIYSARQSVSHPVQKKVALLALYLSQTNMWNNRA